MTALYNDRDSAEAVVEKLKVFAQPQRLMILSCLMRGERNVGEIDEITGIGQPALSQQLAALRRAELVRTRREGKAVWYALTDDNVALCVRNMEAIFAGIGEPEDVAARPAPSATPIRPEATDREARDGTAGFAKIL